MWPFICITKLYVDRWAAAQDDIKLALKVVLDATFKHELSHWYCTLRVGTFIEAFWNAANLLEPERQIEFALFPSPVLQSMNEKHTPKSLNIIWIKGVAEAGDFVKYQGHSSIITFNTLNKAIIQMSPNTSHILQKPYLEARHHKSQLHFMPPSGLPPAKGSIQKPKANASLRQFLDCSPFNLDNGMQTMSNTLVGLGITFTSNVAPRTRCERHVDGDSTSKRASPWVSGLGEGSKACQAELK
ncbi:hypothetical protein PILCRDRAFT_2555 [Piloderma croceum F 1598]|uniref:Uncharacterized protein n=1 Tax=Piloderma croceum (strain F 1598) TaxID=765440 RepID=A0A0C3GF86_PILCF|nr:hypothetical protein PILCRDRAFT_2555 [Piloderma croceum F 1598]